MITFPVVMYVLLRSPRKFSVVPPRGIYSNLSLPTALIIFSLICFAVLNIDLDDLRLVRTFSREEDVFIRIINLHLALFFLLCVHRYSNKNMGINRGGILLLFGLTLSLAISALEGRRTGAVIPIILIGVFSLMQVKSISDSFFKIMCFALIFIVVFVAITLIRTPDISVEFIIKAVFSRLFNPGHIILEIMTQENFKFSPDTISNSVQRIGYIFGLSGYEGSTNEFGRYYGFISSRNFFVGINPGVIVESFLSFGWFYLFPIILFFEATFLLLDMYRKLLYGSDIFVAILVIHGLQMEIPYLVGLLIKLLLVAVLLRSVVVFFPVRSVRRGIS